jgi:hypothetical protein
MSAGSRKPGIFEVFSSRQSATEPLAGSRQGKEEIHK